MGPNVRFKRRDVEITDHNHATAAAYAVPFCKSLEVSEFLPELWIDGGVGYVPSGRYIDVVNVDFAGAGKRDGAPQMPGVSGAAEAFSRQDCEGILRQGSHPVVARLAADRDMRVTETAERFTWKKIVPAFDFLQA
jgi:hypothetical protein